MPSRLNGTQLAVINAAQRTITALRVIGVSSEERVLAGILLKHSHPIPALRLAKATRIPVTSVRRMLADLVELGLGELSADGAVLTEEGRVLFTMLFEDLVGIVSKARRGFSRSLLDKLAALPTDGVSRPFRVSAEAVEIDFSDL